MGGDHSCTYCAGTGKLKCAECAHSYMYGIFRHPRACDECGDTKYKNNVHIDCPKCQSRGFMEELIIEDEDGKERTSDEIRRSVIMTEEIDNGETNEGSTNSEGIEIIRCDKCDGSDNSCLYCAGSGSRKVKKNPNKRKTLRKQLLSSPNRKICVQCKGKGWTVGRVICPKCKGKKLFDYIVCQNCRGSTRVDCLACDATGSTFLKQLRDKFRCCSCCWEKKRDDEDETKNLIE